MAPWRIFGGEKSGVNNPERVQRAGVDVTEIESVNVGFNVPDQVRVVS